MGQPSPIPALRTERCLIYCMNCGRCTSVATFVIEGLFGWLPYGRLTNRLHCKQGCGDRYAVVLPIDAPTPRMFAERYDLSPAPKQDQHHQFRDIETDMRDRLVEIGDGGTFLKVHARSEDPAICQWGFDYLLKKFSLNDRTPPRLAVTRGAQWSRDSARDYKIVSGKLGEKTAEDPDEDEEGYPHD